MKPSWLIFPPPLRVSIPLLVLAFSLVYDVVNTWVLLSRETRKEYRRVQRVALAQAAWLSDAVKTFHLSDNGFPLLERDVRMLVEDSKVPMAVVFDENLRVKYATQKEWVGQDLEDLEVKNELVNLVMEAARTGGPLVATLSRTRVAAAHPLAASANQPPGWVSVVTRDPSEAVREEQWDAVKQGGISAILHLIACIGLWWVLHRFLSQRVAQLLESSRQLTGGAINAQPMSGRDEFAEIARALRASEDIFKQIVENIRDVIFMMTADRRQVLYVSPAYNDMWGADRLKFGSNPLIFLEQVVEEDRELLLKMLDPFMLGKKIVDCEYRIRRPDGEIRWLESRAFPVLDEHGRMHRIAGLTTDVTERKMLEQEVLDISEKERRRIGHDLHDDVCQRLAAVKLGVEMIGDKIAAGKLDEARQMAQSSSKQIGEAATLARNLARGLSPVNLEGEGFLHAIQKLTETSQHLYSVPIRLDSPDYLPMQNATTATHLYRIAQELINNAARHAGASAIEVLLRVEGYQLRLQVANDGLSFKGDESSQKDDGMGLRIIRYRANAIGANLQFLPRKEPNSGTTAICLVPLAACAAAKKNVVS
ncbi:PAS domain S-box protein [Phragmitibacter flavus]|uniref:PAS domain S-box protein n=1 Tax=Phragmitibacter flavus TaxID=2576071 RepID=A0A5R8KET1_9BACT|nr:PAS domain-containing protein [Phragmitibacter flavus]TLD70767.1 PAS domain S-box protein [Phragmitibacter flavus]